MFVFVRGEETYLEIKCKGKCGLTAGYCRQSQQRTQHLICSEHLGGAGIISSFFRASIHIIEFSLRAFAKEK